MATIVIPPAPSVVIPPTTTEPSMADLRRWADADFDGDAPPPPVETPAATEAPASTETPAQPETPVAETTPPAPEPGTEPQEQAPNPETPAEETVSAGVQKRINKAVKAQRDAERRVAELEARLQNPQAPPPAQPTAQPATQPDSTDAPPDPAKFSDWAQYQQALTEHTIDKRERQRAAAEAQRIAQQRGQALTQGWHASEDAARAKHADYEDVIAGVKDIAVPQHLQLAIVESEGELSKADLAYSLAKNRGELERISKLPPTQGVIALGAFIAKQAQQPAPKPPSVATPLPKPPKVAGGSGSAAPVIDLDKADMRTFKREVKKFL